MFPTSYSKEWEVQGWVRDFRSQTDNAFVSIYDGSTSETFQLVCSRDKTTGFDTLDNLRGVMILVLIVKNIFATIFIPNPYSSTIILLN